MRLPRKKRLKSADSTPFADNFFQTIYHIDLAIINIAIYQLTPDSN